MIRDILAYMLEYGRGEFTNIRVEVKLRWMVLRYLRCV